MFYGCDSSDTDPVGLFFSICAGLTHFSLWPCPTVSFPKHMCDGGGYANLCRTGPADTDCGYDTGPCFSVFPLPVVCLHRSWPQSFSPWWRLDHTKAKNAAYVHCQTLWICPSVSDGIMTRLTFYLICQIIIHISFFFLLTRAWWSTWLGRQSDYTICVDHYSQGNKEKWGKASFSFFFQVVCVSRWDGITAQNQGPTGECGVWGTYGQTGCWWAAYTSFS